MSLIICRYKYLLGGRVSSCAPFVLHTVYVNSEIREVHMLPKRLQEIPEPPKRLFARGAWPSQDTRYLAVVGSRALSPYGKVACQKLIVGLQGNPLTIVSGLALGADACAHQAALEAGLHTIAVLASGIDDRSIGPRANAALAKNILSSGGLLLSENPPGYAPKPYDFPKRNRIVAGLADAILIIEAGEKSGTLITARLAAEYNRELLCIPHRITDPHGYGASLFLRLGATLVSEPAHILEALNLKTDVVLSPSSLEEHEELILRLLETPISRAELLEASNLSTNELQTALAKLELKGRIKEEFGLVHRIVFTK